MTAILWAALGGLTAVGLEFAFRSGVSWFVNWWWIIPLSVLINFCIYQLLQTDGSWVYSIALFGFMTALLRVILSLVVLGEPPTIGTMIAAGALLGGASSRILWR